MKWHYEKYCIEMLFALCVIAGVFNVIAAIYFQAAYQQGGSVCLRVHNVCVCDAVFCLENVIKTHFRLTSLDSRIAAR